MWKASDAILEIYHSGELNTELKGDQSPVTRLISRSSCMVNGLSHLTPKFPSVSEEDPDSLRVPQTHRRYWLIDPLDGTKEFINKNDEFTCNLALINSHQTMYGFVSVPVLGLLYYGGDHHGAYRINRAGGKTRIRCRRQSTQPESLLAKSPNPETTAFIDAIETPVELIQAGSSLILHHRRGRQHISTISTYLEWDTAAAQAVLEGREVQ